MKTLDLIGSSSKFRAVIREPMKIGQFLRLSVALSGLLVSYTGAGLSTRTSNPLTYWWILQQGASVSSASHQPTSRVHCWNVISSILRSARGHGNETLSSLLGRVESAHGTRCLGVPGLD